MLSELFHTLFLIIIITFLLGEKCANYLPVSHYEIQKFLLSAESFAGYFLKNISHKKFPQKKFTYKLEEKLKKKNNKKTTRQQQQNGRVYISVKLCTSSKHPPPVQNSID